MKIVYYRIDDYSPNVWESTGALAKNYLSKEKLLQVIKDRYNFLPSFNIPAGRLIGQYADYVDEYTFTSSLSGNFKGFYRLDYEIAAPKIVDNDFVAFSAKVKIQFVTAKIHKTPEKRVPGEPYVPPSHVITEEKVSEFFQLRRCGTDRVVYGIEKSLSHHFFDKTTDCEINEVIFVREKVLEIED